MAEAAASSENFTGRTRKADVARAVLLDAARRVASQSGIDAVTLSAVADEAGMAPATVYAYFRGRNELLQSVIADDLNLLAHAMRQVAGMPEPPKAPATPSRIVRFELKAQGQGMPDDGWLDGDDEAAAETSAPETASQAPSIPPTSAIAFEKPEDHFSSFAPEQFEVAEFGHAPEPSADTTEQTSAAEEESVASAEPATVEPAAEHVEPAEAVSTEAASSEEIAEEPATEERARAEVQEEAAASEPQEQPGADEPASEEEPAVSLEPRLPDREERIQIIGKRRILATEKLRDTMKKIAPVYAPESESVDIIAKLEEAVARREGGFQERMERRFSQLERIVSTLEDRASKTGESVTSALAVLRNGLADLESRTGAADKVQHETMIKMMAEIRDAMRRLDRVEGSSHRRFSPEERMHDSEEGFHALQVVPAPAVPETPADDAEPETREEHEETSPDEAPEADTESAPASAAQRQDDYLAAARRAMSTVANEIEKSNSARSEAKNRQTKFALIGIAAVGIVLVGAAFAAREIALGSSPSQVAHRGLPDRVKVAALTPLDKITADARAGKPEAEVEVGVKYLNGDGIEKNDAEAAKWIQRAAATGYAPGEGWLGTLYDRGKGVAHDPQQAVAWFEKAANKGNRKSMHDLGLAYAQGDGVALNYFQAAHWFSRAASLGYVDSAFNLAILYERGDGVPQSLVDAYKWYAIASAEGDKESATRMEAITPELSPDALGAAKAAAASFRPGATVTSANLVAHDMIIGAP